MQISLKNCTAFSLLEVLIALSILSVVTLSLLRAQSYFWQHAEDLFYQTVVYQQIEDLTVLIRIKPLLTKAEFLPLWQSNIAKALPAGQGDVSALEDASYFHATITWQNGQHNTEYKEFMLTR